MKYKKALIMYNDFVVLGPADDPSGIGGLKDAKESLRMLYRSKQLFVSRGDDSGTDKKEKYLWRRAGLIPGDTWYIETGQGMSATLRVADEKNAYVLVDRATYLFNQDKIRLKKLVEEDGDLFNPYGVIAVNPRKHPHVNYTLSVAFIDRLRSPACQRIINGYRIKGNRLFYANAGN